MAAVLDDIVADASDITEPACMEKVLEYLDELQMETDEFIRLLLDRLEGETISWEQPWYQQSNCLTRPLKHPKEDNLEMYRTDTICKEESDRIEKNWRKFRKKYNLPDTPICFARWKNKDKSRSPNTPEERVRHYVTAYLARGLERNLYQVYKHILTHYGGPVKGAYSEQEEKLMEICFHHCPRKAVTYLSVVLGREPRGIYRRLQLMYNGVKPEVKRMKWSLPLASKFVNSLVRYTGKPLEELKNERIDKSVWLQLQEELDHPYLYLQMFWYGTLHNQIFVKVDVKLKKLRRKILKRLRGFPYQVWSDIRWKEVQKLFPDGFTHYFLYKACYNLARLCDPKYNKAPLDVLINNCLEKIKSIRRNSRLKTLTLNKDGNLELVKYDVKL